MDWKQQRQSLLGAVIVGGGIAVGLLTVCALVVGFAVMSQRIAGWM